MENKVVNLEVKDNLGSLKSQLREAQAEVAALSDKFGATSREAVIAAQKAAILADKIGDAKALTEAFNPDAKFKSLSASLSGVAGGFAAYQGALGLVGVESKELEQQLLRVQSAMAISEGLQGLGEAQDSFKQLKAVGVNAFNSIKTAIGSTGIGLIVIAAGAIYAYWDDIKGAVSGVSEEQKKLNSLSQENADQESEKLKNLNNQDNVLKLQGKSEKEILNIKIKATNEAISAAKINIKNQEITNALSVEGAKRNYEYLKSYIDFISIPQRMIFETGAKAINKMIDLINKIPGVEIKGKIDETFANKASDYITKLAFDPEKTKSKGNATIKAAKESIDKMVNDRAGMQLAINEIDKKGTEANKKAADESVEKALELEKEKADALKANQNEVTQAIGDALDKQAEKRMSATDIEIRNISDKYFRLNELAIQQGRSQEELAILQTQKQNEIDAQKKIKADADAVAKKTRDDKEIADNKAKEDKITADKKAAEDARRNINATAIQSAQQLVGIIAGLGEKNKKLQKAALIANGALSIAEIINNTNVGSAKEVATKGIFGLSTSAVLYAKMAISIGSVIAATAKGLSALGGGGAPNAGGTGGSGGGGGSASQPPAFNVVGASQTNQLAQTIAGQQQQPIKAYVVANDVTTQQSLDRNIVQSASIG